MLLVGLVSEMWHVDLCRTLKMPLIPYKGIWDKELLTLPDTMFVQVLQDAKTLNSQLKTKLRDAPNVRYFISRELQSRGDVREYYAKGYPKLMEEFDDGCLWVERVEYFPDEIPVEVPIGVRAAGHTVKIDRLLMEDRRIWLLGGGVRSQWITYCEMMHFGLNVEVVILDFRRVVLSTCHRPRRVLQGDNIVWKCLHGVNEMEGLPEQNCMTLLSVWEREMNQVNATKDPSPLEVSVRDTLDSLDLYGEQFGS